MDFFEKYYQGNVFQRPAYRELDGSKTIDVYPKKVIILDLWKFLKFWKLWNKAIYQNLIIFKMMKIMKIT
jgi:hypothetical protein